MRTTAEEDIRGVLNPEQWEAVRHNDDHMLILAGAGTGKTRVITHKIAYLVKVLGIRPYQIMAVTFTNKAAGEIRERVAGMLGESSDFPYLGTFHSQGLRMVRRFAEVLGYESGMTICNDDDQVTLVKRVMTELDLDPRAWQPRQIASYIDRKKNHNLFPEDLPDEEFDGPRAPMAQVYRLYQRRLKEANAVDFGDLICLPVRLMREHPEVRSQYQYHLKHILVDEFQDTNAVQYMLLQELGSDENLVTVVGDDDQSIYRWRGAEIGNILSFPEHFPDARVVRLEQNYRSTPPILAAASALIRHNRTRHEKTLRPTLEGGEPVVVRRLLNETGEARFVLSAVKKLRDTIPLDKMAVLYRTNAQSRPFEEMLRFEGLPYRVYGGMRFYERAEIKDSLAYARLVLNPRDDLAFQRVVNNPPRGIGRVTMDKLIERAGITGTSLLAAAGAMLDSGDLRGKRGKGMKDFLRLIGELRAEAEEESATRVMQLCMLRSGYRDALEREDQQGSIDAQSRLENLDELLAATRSFEDQHPDASIQDFLDYVGLVSEHEAGNDREEATLSLMTVHNAKGLEFDAAFVVGVEKNLFPHFNSAESEDGVEEERRLLYVAFTRAKQRLFVTHADTRRRFNRTEMCEPSPYLGELPSDGVSRGRRLSPQEPGTGRKVRHRVFGVGEILKEEGYGPSRRVTIRFPSFGKIRLPARMVTPVEE